MILYQLWYANNVIKTSKNVSLEGNNVFVAVVAFKVPAAMHVVIQEGNIVFTGTER
jgi:hypothetical protein